MFVLYEGVIFVKKYKTVTKKSVFRNNDTWKSPIRLRIYQTITNNRPCWIYPYGEVEESVSFEYILVALRALHNAITNLCGLVLPPLMDKCPDYQGGSCFTVILTDIVNLLINAVSGLMETS